jgi:predicted dehydrogenase
VSEVWNYRADQEHPSWAGDWEDGDGNLLDLSTGFTFDAWLVDEVEHTVAHTITTGITGDDVSPNILVAFANGALATAFGSRTATRDFRLHVRARTAGSADRFYRPNNEDIIRIGPVPT